MSLTEAEAETLRIWRAQGCWPSYITDVFPARDNVDNARRRTCRRLIALGLLVESRRRPGQYYAVRGDAGTRYEGTCPFCGIEVAVDLDLPHDPPSTGWICPACGATILLRSAAGLREEVQP